MDINPATPGHGAVVPRTHGRSATRTPTAVIPARHSAWPERMKNVLGADGINLMPAAAAWQTVFHFHIHVVPRYVDDPQASLDPQPVRRDRGDCSSLRGDNG